MKINVTNSALVVIKDIQKSNNNSDQFFRIQAASFGWGLPSLGIVLDEQNKYDEVFNINGISFLIGSDLYCFEGYEVDGFEVDYLTTSLNKGFVVSPLYFTDWLWHFNYNNYSY